MTANRSILLGAIIGVAAAAGVIALVNQQRTHGSVGMIVPDAEGAIESVVIQYVSDSGDIVLPVYQQFIGALPPEVVMYAVCPTTEAFDKLTAALGEVRCKVKPVVVDHAMSAWSRDRWLAVADAEGEYITLLTPRGEQGAESWPARAGDAKLAGDLAASVSHTRARRSGLYFDGGDFVVTDECVFVTPRVAQRNVPILLPDRAALAHDLEAMLGRRVVLLGDAPPHHAGMYMMSAGGKTMLVGDPSLALPLVGEGEPAFAYDFADATQAKFDAVAAQCETEGFTVLRVPVVAGADGRTYITSLNAIIDERSGKRIVYMPTFDGFEAINDRAAEVWRSTGAEVVPIDCTTTFRQFGNLRCLVNVMGRGDR